MALFTRMILVVVLAIFAAGSVAHAAGATTMAVEMATVEAAADMSMADCNACDDDGGTGPAVCDLVCSAGGFAAIPAVDAPEIMPTQHDLRQRLADVKLSSLGSLPLRDPPRHTL